MSNIVNRNLWVLLSIFEYDQETGHASYCGLVRVNPGTHHTNSSVHCDALLLDENARTDTYPTIRVEENQTEIDHEATVLKVDDDQLFYVISRGLDESEAYSLIVNEFIEPIAKDLRCQAVWAK